MRLKLRSTEPAVKREVLYSITAAAREVGLSRITLRRLVNEGIVAPQNFDDGTRKLCAFSQADLDQVINYYIQRGGIRALPTKKVSV